MQGCVLLLGSGVRPVPVEEVDSHGISLDRAWELQRGDPAESVLQLLGEPADRMQSCVPGEVVWRYPIRAWNDVVNRREIVPAVLLRIVFDESKTLTYWGFVDALAGHSLPILEGAADASRWPR